MSGGPLLVVGLGNPGPRYANTRHNIGQFAVDALVEELSISFSKHRANAVVAEGRLAPGGRRVILAKPNSFMNLSGGPVSQLLRFYGLDNSSLLVVHDELDIPFDSIKLKVSGGHGGHNGLRDIIAATGNGNFCRLRLGIGRPPGRQDAANFVLSPFSSTERTLLPNFLADAVDAIRTVAEEGLLSAQQKFHAPKP